MAAMRKTDPAYRVSGDGIHPDANGHFVIFRELAKALALSDEGVAASIDAAKGESGSPAISSVKVGLRKLELVWKPLLPLPHDPGWNRRLIEVEGKSVAGKKPEDVRSLTRGDAGSEIHLKVEREGEPKPVEFVLVREEIQLKNLSYADYIGDGIAYAHIERFTRGAGEELSLAIKNLLRFFPGV